MTVFHHQAPFRATTLYPEPLFHNFWTFDVSGDELDWRRHYFSPLSCIPRQRDKCVLTKMQLFWLLSISLWWLSGCQLRSRRENRIDNYILSYAPQILIYAHREESFPLDIVGFPGLLIQAFTGSAGQPPPDVLGTLWGWQVFRETPQMESPLSRSNYVHPFNRKQQNNYMNNCIPTFKQSHN